MHENIGRLIRACAEIEDIIGLHLNYLACIGEAESIILLGRLGAAAKLKMATTIAHMLGGEVQAVHDRCFDNEGFRGVMKCRNTVAHGLLLGVNDDGLLSFVTLDPAGGDEARLSMNVISYDPRHIGECADMAENSIPELERLLKLEAWRQKRRSRDLLPHRKAQTKEKQGAKQKRPPRSS
jgi:hypothetical protein